MRKRIAAAVALALAACMALALCGCAGGYEPELKNPTVDASALASPGVLRVGVDTASYPFAGQARGDVNGIDVDVAAALADEMGLRLELVDTGMRGAAALSEGAVDLVMGLDRDDTPADSCWMSEPYIDSCISVFSIDEQAAPAKSPSPTIGAQTSSLSAWMVSRQYGAGALKASDELKGVFRDLDGGVVPYAAADAVVGSYVVNSLNMDADIVGLMEEPSGYCIGAAVSNTALQLAVTQALSAIEGNGVLDVIMTRWVGGSIDLSSAGLTEPAREELEAARRAAEEAAAQEAAAAEGEDGESGETPQVGSNAVAIQ